MPIETVLASTKSIVGFGRTKYKNFLWDQVIIYLCVCLVVLLAVAVGEEFLGGGGAVVCLTPNDFTRDQVAFVNGMCSEGVNLLRLLPLFLLGELVFLVGPHVLWTKIAGPHLEEFFSLSPTIDRYRDRRTGLFSSESVEIVKLLQNHFSRSHLVYKSYVVKLLLQLIFALVIIVLMFVLYLLVEPTTYGSTFQCTIHESLYKREWFRPELDSLCDSGYIGNSSACTGDFPASLPCAFTLGLLFVPLWYSNVPLLLLVAFMASYGLVKLCLCSHGSQLDYRTRAKLLYTLCAYRPRMLEELTSKGEPDQKSKDTNTKQGNKSNTSTSANDGEDNDDVFPRRTEKDPSTTESKTDTKRTISPTEPRRAGTKRKIESDLDFLSLLLASSDKGHGRTFFEVQVEIHTSEIWTKDYQQHLHSSSRTDEKNSKKKKKYELALHLFCGPKGGLLSLCKMCNKVIAIDFNCYFDPLRDREDPQFGKIITNDDREKQAQSQKDQEDAENSKYVYRDDYDDFQVYAVPGNFISWSSSHQKELFKRLQKHPMSQSERAKYDLVLITDFEEAERPVTAQRVLNSLNEAGSFMRDQTVFIIGVNGEESLKSLKEGLCFELSGFNEDSRNFPELEMLGDGSFSKKGFWNKMTFKRKRLESTV